MIGSSTCVGPGPDASPEAPSPYGAMHLVQAVISGHEGDRARARSRPADAKRIAEQLGADRNDDDTELGPTNTDLHTVAVVVAVDLGDARALAARRSPHTRYAAGATRLQPRSNSPVLCQR
jgi:hypothetical protein